MRSANLHIETTINTGSAVNLCCSVGFLLLVRFTFVESQGSRSPCLQSLGFAVGFDIIYIFLQNFFLIRLNEVPP